MRYLETAQGTRTDTVTVRLMPVEKVRLFKEAQKLGISTSAFVRLLLSNWTNKVNFSKK